MLANATRCCRTGAAFGLASIELNASLMLIENSDAAWERYGRLDPYFGVCNDDSYHTGNLNERARDEFFRSGMEHLESVLDTIRCHFDPDFQPQRSLDFGCGVGRLLIPLSRISEQVVGVDVSEAMLSEAAKNCRVHSATNVRLARSDDRLSQVDGGFDFIHSVIVFQHIPPARGTAILRELMLRLERNGVGAIHITYGRNATALRKTIHWMRKYLPLVNSTVNLAQGRPFSYPMMQMNSYDLESVFGIIQGAGCTGVHVQFTDHGGHLGAMLFFRRPA